MALSQSELSGEITRLGHKIGLQSMIPFELWEPNDYASPFIVIENDLYHYRVRERAQLLEDKTTSRPDELLFWIFSDITFGMASAFEFKNRVQDQDCRRIIFAKQLELLEKLNPEWHSNVAGHHAKILEEHPFDDRQS